MLNAPGPRRRPRLGTPSQSLTSASQDQLPPFEFSSIHPGSPTHPDPPTTATCLSEDAGDVQGRGASHQHVLIGDVKLSDMSRDRRLGKSLGAQAHAHHTYQNRQAGRTWKVVHFSNTLYPPSPTAGRAGEDRARRGETTSCVRRATSGAWTRQAEGLLSDKPHQPATTCAVPALSTSLFDVLRDTLQGDASRSMVATYGKSSYNMGICVRCPHAHVQQRGNNTPRF